MRLPLIALIAFLISAAPSLAAGPVQADAANPDKDKPLEISAKQTLEWRRNDSQYIARGDVVAKQGDTAITGDTMTADYRSDDRSKNDIYRLTATGSVSISGQNATATGDRAVYDVDKGVGTLTGKTLLLTTPDQTVTARDRFEYTAATGRMSAIGSAHAVRGQDTIDADILSAVFVENPVTKQRELARLEAEGHVVITTPTETLHGDRGVYVKGTNIGQVFGHVLIKRGPNVLEGDSADIDMNTNISRMHAGSAPNARVRGVFYPGTQKDAPAGEASISTVSTSVQPAPPPQAAPVRVDTPVR